MNRLPPAFDEVVLICNNTRPPGAPKHSCGDHGAWELRKWLKRELKKEGLWGEKVRVVLTSCLDFCPSEGVVCSFDRGRSLVKIDAQTDREIALERIRELCG